MRDLRKKIKAALHRPRPEQIPVKEPEQNSSPTALPDQAPDNRKAPDRATSIEDPLPAYHYTNLQSPNHIRILVFPPGSHRAQELECQLLETELSDGTDYEALSYSWADRHGDKSLSKRLKIDGRYLSITKNLYDGLLRIRRSDTTRLWVDAVCINQTNVAERNSQVARMADIYRLASRVIAWIGDDLDEDDNQLAAEMVNEAQDPRPPEQLGDLVMYYENGFQAILNCRYFKRRWIVQELYFAKDVQVRWSRYTCSLQEFQKALALQRKNAAYVPDQVGFLVNFIDADFQPGFLMGNKDSEVARDPLAVTLSKYADMECGEPLDRLYSLLSLDPQCGLEPDYSISVGQMGQNIARYLQDWGFTKTLLRNACGVKRLSMRYLDRRQPSTAPDTPSWATDLMKSFNFVDRTAAYVPPGNGISQLQASISLAPESILTVSLLRYGVCSDWREGIPGYVEAYDRPLGFKNGFRELTQTPHLSFADVLISGIGYESDIHEADLQTGDVICSVDKEADWTVALRQASETSYRLVGLCKLIDKAGKLWRIPKAEWKEFRIV